VGPIGCQLHFFEIAAGPHSIRRPIGAACPQQLQFTQEASSMTTMCQRRTGECPCADDADPKLMVRKDDTTFQPSGN
jgi:hypothetical protein